MLSAFNVSARTVIDMRKMKKGFSIVELAIVIVVLGILSSVAFVGFQQIVKRSDTERVKEQTRTWVRQSQALYALKAPTDPTYTWETALLEVAADLPPYSQVGSSAWATGAQAVNTTVNGWRVESDTAGDTSVFSTGPNHIVVRTSGSTMYFAVATEQSSSAVVKGVFGAISERGTASLWTSNCAERSCDADSAYSGPQAAGSYSTSIPGSVAGATTTTAAPTTTTAGATTTTAGTTTTTAPTTTTAGTTTTTAPTTTAVPSSVPGAPTSVSGTASNASVALTWTAPSSNGGAAITDYVVQYSSNSGTTWTTFAGSVSSATSATVTGLTNGTGYIFHIAATNSVGTGSYSTSSSVVTPVTTPGAPTSVSATAGNASVALTWTAPASNGGSAITDYDVEYSSNAGTTWTTFTDGVSTAASATVTGLTNGTAYTFRVSATNAFGTGATATSSSVTPATVPSPPSPIVVAETAAASALVQINTASAAARGSLVTSVVASCTATGFPTLTYTWSASLGTNPAGTYPALTTSWATPVAGAIYTCSVTATNSVGTSTAATAAY